MKEFIASFRDDLTEHQRHPSSHDLASQHKAILAILCLWAIVCSLAFLALFHFGATWVAVSVLCGGIAATIAMGRDGERQTAIGMAVVARKAKSQLPGSAATREYSGASRCVWKLDSEG